MIKLRNGNWIDPSLVYRISVEIKDSTLTKQDRERIDRDIGQEDRRCPQFWYQVQLWMVVLQTSQMVVAAAFPVVEFKRDDNAAHDGATQYAAALGAEITAAKAI